MRFLGDRSYNRKAVLADDPKAATERPTSIRPTERQRRLIQWVADSYEIPAAWIRQHDNTRTTVAARHMCMFLLVECGGLSTTLAGRTLGGFDHTTVMHALRKVRAAQDADRVARFMDGAAKILDAKSAKAIGRQIVPEPKEVRAA